MRKLGGQNIYDKLLEQPLFQGMSQSDLDYVVSHIKFNVFRYKNKEIIVNEGDLCDQLRFITKGMLQTKASNDNHSFTLIEHLQAPHVMQPERIFGLTQRHTKSFTAKGECYIISIDKNDVMRLTDKFMIFRLNLLNIVSTQAQKSVRWQWRHTPETLRQRIVRFFETHCERPTGYKIIQMKMTRLANELNDKRLNISHELNKMQDEGFIILKRETIHIPAFERLIM